MKLATTIISVLISSVISLSGFGQEGAKSNITVDPALSRVNKIVSSLAINDKAKKTETLDLLKQYFDTLTVVFNERKKGMESATTVEDKELASARSRTAWDAGNSRINKVYATFLGRLSTKLTAEQIDRLKNEMTEGGMLREYNNYLDLFPNLNSYQKVQLTAYLSEARENAMNAETADQRNEWFIKFRGRANNFLAAAGYDLRKATDEQKKRKADKLKAQ